MADNHLFLEAKMTAALVRAKRERGEPLTDEDHAAIHIESMLDVLGDVREMVRSGDLAGAMAEMAGRIFGALAATSTQLRQTVARLDAAEARLAALAPPAPEKPRVRVPAIVRAAA